MALLTEEEITHFMKTSTPEDIEMLMNSVILTKKHIDKDTKVSKKYFVKLFDEPRTDNISYQVSSNAIGLEAIKRITSKHNISDGGSETNDSKYFSFYSQNA